MRSIYKQLKKFVSKRGNFAEILMKKIYTKKVLLYLSNYNKNEKDTKLNLSRFELKA